MFVVVGLFREGALTFALVPEGYISSTHEFDAGEREDDDFGLDWEDPETLRSSDV